MIICWSLTLMYAQHCAHAGFSVGDANQVFTYTPFLKPVCDPLLGRPEDGKVDQGEAIYEGLARVRLLVVWELKRKGGSLPEGFVWRFLECGGAKEVQPINLMSVMYLPYVTARQFI